MTKERTPFPFPLEQDAIFSKRAHILSRLLAEDEAFCSIPVRGISQRTLNLLLVLYDQIFFNNCLECMRIQVALSSRMTSSAGKFVYQRGALGRIRHAQIRMSSDFLLRLDQGPFELNGLLVSTPQEAFLLVFEHELCHAAEMLLYGNTGHSSRYLTLARGLFGHTAVRHKLPTRSAEAAKSGLLVGSRVSFLHHDQELSGIITYIGKMATVMVPSPCGEYRDKRGRRYTKYRVLPDKLKKNSL